METVKQTITLKKILWLLIPLALAVLALLAYGADIISLNSPVTFPVDI